MAGKRVSSSMWRHLLTCIRSDYSIASSFWESLSSLSPFFSFSFLLFLLLSFCSPHPLFLIFSFFFDKVFLPFPHQSNHVFGGRLFTYTSDEKKLEIKFFLLFSSSFLLFFFQGFEGQSKVINPKERKNEQRDLFLSVHHKIYCLFLSL